MSFFLSKKFLAVCSSSVAEMCSRLGRVYKAPRAEASLRHTLLQVQTFIQEKGDSLSQQEVESIRLAMEKFLKNLKPHIRSGRIYSEESSATVRSEIVDYGRRLNGYSDVEKMQGRKEGMITRNDALKKYEMLLSSPELSVTDLNSMQGYFLYSHPVPTTTDLPMTARFLKLAYRVSHDSFQADIDSCWERMLREYKGGYSECLASTVETSYKGCEGQLAFLNRQKVTQLADARGFANFRFTIGPKMQSQVEQMELLNIFVQTEVALKQAEASSRASTPRTPGSPVTAASSHSSGFVEGPGMLDPRALRRLGQQFDGYVTALQGRQGKSRAELVLEKSKALQLRVRADKENGPRTPVQVATPTMEDIELGIFRSIRAVMGGTPLKEKQVSEGWGPPIPFSLSPLTSAPKSVVSPATPANGVQLVLADEPPNSWQMGGKEARDSVTHQKELKEIAALFSTTCYLLARAGEESRHLGTYKDTRTPAQVEAQKRRDVGELLGKAKAQAEMLGRKYREGGVLKREVDPSTPLSQVVADLSDSLERVVHSSWAKNVTQAPIHPKKAPSGSTSPLSTELESSPLGGASRASSMSESPAKPLKLDSSLRSAEHEASEKREAKELEEFLALEKQVIAEAAREAFVQAAALDAVGAPQAVQQRAPAPQIQVGFVPSGGILKQDDPTAKRFVTGTFHDATGKCQAEGVFLVERDRQHATFKLVFGKEHGKIVNRIKTAAYSSHRYVVSDAKNTMGVRNYLNGRVERRDRLDAALQMTGDIVQDLKKAPTFSMSLEAFSEFKPEPGAKRHYSAGITPPK